MAVGEGKAGGEGDKSLKYGLKKWDEFYCIAGQIMSWLHFLKTSLHDFLYDAYLLETRER